MPRVTWPPEASPGPGDAGTDVAESWARMANRQRMASVEHAREARSVYAFYNTRRAGDFMPIRRAGDFYVHLGDGVGEAGDYRIWDDRADARDRIAENRQRFETFLADVLTRVEPDHVLMTSWMSAGDGVDESLLVYHRDAREFLRDLLRGLFLMADELRRHAETSPDMPAVRRVDYLDDRMREPESLCDWEQLNTLRGSCAAWLRATLDRRPGVLDGYESTRSDRLRLFDDGPRFARAIRTIPPAKVAEILSGFGHPAFHAAGSGWLLMDAGSNPLAVNEFYRRLVVEVRRFD